MLHALKLLKFLAYVFATSVVVMVLGLFYGLVPVAILDAKSLVPALTVFYQASGVVAAVTVLPTIGFFALNSYENDLAEQD